MSTSWHQTLRRKTGQWSQKRWGRWDFAQMAEPLGSTLLMASWALYSRIHTFSSPVDVCVSRAPMLFAPVWLFSLNPNLNKWGADFGTFPLGFPTVTTRHESWASPRGDTWSPKGRWAALPYIHPHRKPGSPGAGPWRIAGQASRGSVWDPTGGHGCSDSAPVCPWFLMIKKKTKFIFKLRAFKL